MARYIRREDATTYLTKYIPSVEAVERSKIDKAIEEIEKEIKSDFWKSDVTFGLELAKKILEKNLGE